MRGAGPLSSMPYEEWPDEDLARREEVLVDALRALELPEPSPTVPLGLLPDGATLTIGGPCPERWQTMIGDDRTRHCSRCEKRVHNLGAMSKEEIAQLFASGAKPCVRFFRRADGAVMTSDCQVGRPKRVVLRVLAAVAVAAGAVALAEGLESRMFRGRIESTSVTGDAIPTS